MEISIIIPVYNTDFNAFKRCIDSILKINDKMYEVIIIDDGSYEKNSITYKEYVESKENIRYYRTINKGVSSARNLGIKKSSGKYVLFVDSDDELVPENIDWDLLEKDYDFIIYDYNLIKSKKIVKVKEMNINNITELKCIDVLKEYIISDKFYSPFSKFIKKDFLLKYNIQYKIDMINGEDAIFNLDILCNNPKLFYVNNSIYNYYYTPLNYVNRIKNNFDRTLNDYFYKYDRKNIVIENMSIDKSTIAIIQNKAVNQVFLVSMICLDLNMKKSKEISDYLDKFNIQYSVLTFQNKIKYKLIQNQNKLIIKIFSTIRKIFLKIKKG